jgi:hypothetical protein
MVSELGLRLLIAGGGGTDLRAPIEGSQRASGARHRLAHWLSPACIDRQFSLPDSVVVSRSTLFVICESLAVVDFEHHDSGVQEESWAAHLA